MLRAWFSSLVVVTSSACTASAPSAARDAGQSEIVGTSSADTREESAASDGSPRESSTGANAVSSLNVSPSTSGDTQERSETQVPDADTSSASTSETPSSDPPVATVDAGGEAVSCDERALTCKRAAPECDYGYVPRIVAGCYAECVSIGDCVCTGADACPDRDRYTCNNSRQRCTPYLR